VAVLVGAHLVLALLPRARTDPEDEREGRIPATEVPLTGDELFAAVTEAMVAFTNYSIPQELTVATAPTFFRCCL
jgi:hypothetical protein